MINRAACERLILSINDFVARLDPAVRAEAFRLLIGVCSRELRTAPRADSPQADVEPEQPSQTGTDALAKEVGAAPELLQELFEVVEPGFMRLRTLKGLGDRGGAQLAQKAATLIVYANCAGFGKKVIDRKAVLKNLRELGIEKETTAYGRDADRAELLQKAGGSYHMPSASRSRARRVLKEALGLPDEGAGATRDNDGQQEKEVGK